ncbi:hypothetical protein V0288_18375 [Pannus brasiliensis CCIBt3594]|uniref:Uncharacterized protein n=1 Tax=Pannus brasiliensis CCIBt3594 TaxID=1427578 RepID=A0AAW9QYY4_9CHRO
MVESRKVKSIISIALGFWFGQSIALVPRSNAQSAITLNTLQSATYNIPNYGKVTLNNGNFQGNTGKITAVTLSQDALIGNFTGDNYEDGVAVLRVTFDPSTGLRSKYYLALVADSNGTPSNVDTVFLGEGVNIDRVATQNGTVTVTMGVYYPGDPPCCPQGISTRQYTVNPAESRLVLTSVQDRLENTVTERNFPVPRILNDNLPYQPPADEIQVNF